MSLTRLLAAAFGIVLAVGAGSATARLLWCPGMQEARIRCCCPVVDDHDVVRAPCCEAQATFTPDGVQAHDGNPRIAGAQAAPIVARLEIPGERRTPPRASERTLHARAGPSARLHARNSIYLV